MTGKQLPCISTKLSHFRLCFWRECATLLWERVCANTFSTPEVACLAPACSIKHGLLLVEIWQIGFALSVNCANAARFCVVQANVSASFVDWRLRNVHWYEVRAG